MVVKSKCPELEIYFHRSCTDSYPSQYKKQLCGNYFVYTLFYER